MPATALLDTFQHSAPDSHEDSLNTVKTSQERALCFETLSLKSRAETCFCYGWILQNGRLTKFQHISTVYERHGKNDGKNEISKKKVRSPWSLYKFALTFFVPTNFLNGTRASFRLGGNKSPAKVFSTAASTPSNNSRRCCSVNLLTDSSENPAGNVDRFSVCRFEQWNDMD